MSMFDDSTDEQPKQRQKQGRSALQPEQQQQQGAPHEKRKKIENTGVSAEAGKVVHGHDDVPARF
jgi:hypothetical protein